MNGEEIKTKIDQFNFAIEQEMCLNKFVLNKKIMNYMIEIEKLQEKCEHKYKDCVCIYCGKGEYE